MTLYLIANWKMNLPAEGIETWLARIGAEPAWSSTTLGIAPPFPFISQMVPAIRRSDLLGAQNCSEHRSGAFTGEVSAGMLRSAGAAFVILGHSERRAQFHESEAEVGRKVAAALAVGLRPLLCVGEDLATRENGGTMSLVAGQLAAVFDALMTPPPELLVAYEPVWAIGTGRNATPSMAAETHAGIRAAIEGQSGGRTRPTILYGGSVKAENASELAAEREIEGFLVGGASLESASFLAIGKALDDAGRTARGRG